MSQSTHTPGTQSMLNQSLAMSKIMKEAEQVARTSMTVLILGETGVGKGVLAQWIHAQSLRQTHPFVSVNCAGLSPELVGSELFGHERGSFTSAVNRRIGRFEQAHGGTLFLDEIGDLSLTAQLTLLHILEDDHLTRVGGETSIEVDVRVIAATNRDLQQAIQAGIFREDLLHRLDEFPITVPPLRERQEEIPIFAAHFMARGAEKLRRPVPHLTDEVVRHLQKYNWPGNVRELEHRIQRAVVICQGDVIQVEDVPFPAEAQVATPISRPLVEQAVEPKTDLLADTEKKQIIAALQATNWRIYGEQGAAQLLGIHPERLRSRMRVYELKRPKKPS